MSAFFVEPFTTPLFENPTVAYDFEDYSSLLATGGFSLMDGGDLFAGASSSMTSTQVVPDQQPSAPAPAPAPATSSSSKRKRSRAPSISSSSPSSDSPSPPAAAAERGGGRRVWVRERSTEWWERMSDAAACPEAEFRRAFRMPRRVFDKLCDDLAGAVAKEDTTLRAAIPVPQRVAVCLYRLATGDPLREVSRRFGLGISTCHNIILEVCAALTAVLLTRVVRWPDSHAAAAGDSGFDIPGVVGAVHTERIPIVAPRENAGEYYDRRLTDRNQKATYSVTMQAVVDAGGAFTDVCIGHPGSLSDDAVLERSALHARCEAGLLLLGGDVHHRCCLVGGASYPLRSWMLVPYTHANLTWAQHKLNERVAGARAAATGAFRRLRARWRCLQRRAEVKLPELPNMLGACCVLHNLCERSGDGLNDDDLLVGTNDDGVDDGVVVAAGDRVWSAAAEQVRDRIAHVLLHSGSASSSSYQVYSYRRL